MLPFLLAVPSLQLPAVDVLRSSVLRGLETSERGVYTAERQREELGRRLRDRLSGGDGLSRLAAADSKRCRCLASSRRDLSWIRLGLGLGLGLVLGLGLGLAGVS